MDFEDAANSNSVIARWQHLRRNPALSTGDPPSCTMDHGPSNPDGGSHESGVDHSPVGAASVSRIGTSRLPTSTDHEGRTGEWRIAKDAKGERRKTINGDGLLWAMAMLGFEDYIEPLKLYLHKSGIP